MTKQVSLSVNDISVPLDGFVEEFIDYTTGGIIAALDGTGEIKNLELSIEGDAVTINLNNVLVPVNDFATEIIRNTVTGMISPLKGVGRIDRVKINVTR